MDLNFEMDPSFEADPSFEIDPDFQLDPMTELREILNKQLLLEARNGGDVERILNDEEYRDPRDPEAFLFDINCMDIFGDTPLHYAILSGDYDNINHIIHANGCDVDPQNFNGDTPLHLAVQIPQPKARRAIVSLLVETAGATDSIRIKNRARQTPNDIAKIYCPNDTEVSSLTTPPARQVDAILDKSDIAYDDDDE